MKRYKKYIDPLLIGVALLGSATALIAIYLSGTIFPPQPPAESIVWTAPYTRQQVLDSVNKVRAENGRHPLILNGQLNQSSTIKSQDMTTKGYWAHVSPTGETPWTLFEQVGYDYKTAGEVLARCYTTVDGVVRGWERSQKHFEVMIGDYIDVGFGTSVQEDGCIVVTGHFGKK